jgi:hypothetical protein
MGRENTNTRTTETVSQIPHSFLPRVHQSLLKDNSHKKYVLQHLRIKKMFELYVDKCKEKNITPVKEWHYCHIFYNEF